MQKLNISMALHGLHKALVANQNYKIDYLDVKFLNEEEFKLRLEVKRLISTYRAWQEMLSYQRDIRVIMLGNLRARSMTSNLKETLKYYAKVKKLRKFYTDIYLSQLPKNS